MLPYSMETVLTNTILYAQENIEVTTQSEGVGFFSILLGTLTPALLIAISYLLVKMFNKK